MTLRTDLDDNVRQKGIHKDQHNEANQAILNLQPALTNETAARIANDALKVPLPTAGPTSGQILEVLNPNVDPITTQWVTPNPSSVVSVNGRVGVVVGLAEQSDLTTEITNSVHLTGPEIITGIKTFSATPVVPDSSWTIAKTAGLQTALNSKQGSDQDLTDIAGLTRAKGDLIVGSSSAWINLPVGSNTQILTADSTSSGGVKWSAAGISLTDGDKGDIVVSGTGTIWAIDTGVIVNAQVSASAAIARAKLDFGSGLVNADISVSAAIVRTKLDFGSGLVNADISNTAAIAYSKLNLATSILNADISASAAIAYSKLNLTGLVVNADISASAAIIRSKLNFGSGLVDADISASAAIALSKLAVDPLARANHTGTQLAATISNFDTQVRTSRLDQMTTPTADVAFGSHKITGLIDGVALTDAATVGQVSAALNNQTWKNPADAMTTGALPTLTATTTTLTANANGALAAQDGVTLAANDTLLVKNQATGAQDGIYIVTQVGTGSLPFILTRRSDANTAAFLTDATILVDAGTSGLGDIYTFPTIATLGTTDATPAKTGEGNTVYTADGTTITLTGQSFGITSAGVGPAQLASSVAGAGIVGGAGSALDINTDNSSVEINTDILRVKALGITNAMLAGSIAYSKLTLTNSIVNGDIVAAAGIPYSKLTLTGAILNTDIVAAAGIPYSKLTLTGTIVNADVATGAAITYAKLNLATSILNADIAVSAGIVYSKLSLTNSIVNADIASAAAIARTKLDFGSGLVNADIATGAAIAYAKLNLATSIVNADVSASAAIAYSKLSLATSIVNADISASAAIVYSKLSLTGGIVNADVNTSAAIAYSKLNLATSIVNADVSASAAIVYSKLSLATSIVNADIAVGAAIVYSKLSLTNSIVDADIASGAAIALSKLAARKVTSTTSTTTLTVAVTAKVDEEQWITAQAAGLTIAAPTGSPVSAQRITFRIKDNGTPQTLTWDAAFRIIGTVLPTITVANKTVYVGTTWNSTDSKWDVLAISQEA